MFRKLRETETLANELLEFGKTQWIQDNNFVQVELREGYSIRTAFKWFKRVYPNYHLTVVLNHTTEKTLSIATEDISFKELKDTVNGIIEYVSTAKVDHSVFNNKLLEYVISFNENTFKTKFSSVDIKLIQNNLDYVYTDIEPLLRILYTFEKFEQLSSYVEQYKYCTDIVEIVKKLLISELEKIDNIRSLEVDSALNRLKELAEKEG